MKMRKLAAIYFASIALTACGGGGGDSGSSSFGTGSGASPGSDGGAGSGATAPAPAYVLAVDVLRNGESASSVTSVETVQAVATVTTRDGKPVGGVVVAFSETGPGLITFAPVAATALSNSSGRAVVDLVAGAPSRTGATTISATATVESVNLSANKSIQINAGAITTGPPPAPFALNFVSSSPSGTAIVVKGSGGTGRSESAILSFKVVDVTGAPINGATVNFSLNSDNGGASIQPTRAVSNSDGLVSVTVSSGLSPASIVVRAVADSAPNAASQSDTLIVSNDVAIAGGFEIASGKYNLDGRLVGDSTEITAYVRDRFGNLVADGVAVSFQTDQGAVGTSTLGGCTTVNGRCKVPFYVQAPRDRGVATVVATVRVSNDVVLSDDLKINMAGAGSPSGYIATEDAEANTELTKLSLSTCKKTELLYLSDGSRRSPAAGTTIAPGLLSSGVKVTVKAGSPVPDELNSSFPPVPFGIEVDLTDSNLSPACSSTKTLPRKTENFFVLEFRSPGGLLYSTKTIKLEYPY